MKKQKVWNTSPVIFAVALALTWPGVLMAQQPSQEEQLSSVAIIDESGKFEIGVYYGRWTLNPILSQFEADLGEELGQQIRDAIIDEVRDLNPYIAGTDSVDNFAFDSSGPSYGLEARFYPQGRLGSFSLGLSIDKLTMRISGEGSVSQNFDDGTSAEAGGSGEIVLSPLFTTLSFRWDIMPRWRISPYYSMGLGVAALGGGGASGDVQTSDNGEGLSWEYAGTYTWAAGDYTVSGSDQLTIKEAEEEGDFNIPGILPLIAINLGVRAEITPNLLLRAEAGFWDGIAFRFGVSGRF